MDNFLYGKDKKILEEQNKININEINNEKISHNINENNKEEEENKLDINLILNSKRSVIQRRTTRTKRIKGEKNKNIKGNIGIIKEYAPNDCVLNLSKDLKCGCAGNVDNACFIF